MAERQVAHLECPSSPFGILQLLRRVLVHNVNNVTIRPGIEMEVDWVGTHSEALTAPLPDEDIRSALERVQLEQLNVGAVPAQALLEAFTWLSARGLFPAYMVSSSEMGVRHALGVPDVAPAPDVDVADPKFRYKLLIGLPFTEWSDLSEGVVVVLGSSIPGADLNECTHAVQFWLDYGSPTEGPEA